MYIMTRGFYLKNVSSVDTHDKNLSQLERKQFLQVAEGHLQKFYRYQCTQQSKTMNFP